jgi:hypothetical protein
MKHNNFSDNLLAEQRGVSADVLFATDLPLSDSVRDQHYTQWAVTSPSPEDLAPSIPEIPTYFLEYGEKTAYRAAVARAVSKPSVPNKMRFN